jgi:hypothetical protein
MSVLTMRSAEEGWRLFQQADPPVDFEAINRQLENLDLPKVSSRMYDHYRRLKRHGFDRYMPINELDMVIKTRRRERREARD